MGFCHGSVGEWVVRYLSLFSGMEAAHLAWAPLGWECAGVAEIEPAACTLLRHRLPNVPNLGNVTEITDDQIKALGPINAVIGGSPCQDLSVAGRRAGLGGARSSLFHQQMRIFNAARHFCGARWLIWENVPGAFSSNSGRDFAVVVGAMAGCQVPVPIGGWGSEGVALGDNGLVEWSVLDAQWFGVAQRRRRVFAVLDTGNWASRPPVLLEPESLRGDSAPSRQARQSTSGSLEGGARQRSADSTHHISLTAFGGNNTSGPIEVGTCLNACSSASGRLDFESETFLVEKGSRALRDSAYPNGHAAEGESKAVAFAQNQRDEVREMRVAGALAAEPGMKQTTYLRTGLQVRRLTPLECERLQGATDDWTLVTDATGKPMADGPRYKMLGNSFAVPVIRWIGQRIDLAMKSASREAA